MFPVNVSASIMAAMLFWHGGACLTFGPGGMQLAALPQTDSLAGFKGSHAREEKGLAVEGLE